MRQSAFFGEIFRNCAGYILIRILPSNRCWFVRRAKVVWTVSLARALGEDVYFGVCPRARKWGTAAGVREVPCLWADLDAKDFAGGKREALAVLRRFEYFPSVIVDSGNGYHCYWVLKEAEAVPSERDRQHFRGYLRGLARAVGGDLAVCELARILRVPGTWNLKDPGHPKPVRIVELSPELRYNPGDFSEYFEPVTEFKCSDVDLSGTADIPQHFHALLSQDSRLRAVWDGRRELRDQTRSGFDMSLADLLIQAGQFTDGEIAAILRAAPSGRGGEATERYLSLTIAKARAWEKHFR